MGFISGWGASAFYPSSARHCYPCAKPWHGGLCGYRGWSCHLFYSHWEGSKASMGAFSEASRLGVSREIKKMPSGSFGALARRGLDSVNWRFREFLDPLIKIRHSFSGSTVEICLWRTPVGTAPTGEWSLFIDPAPARVQRSISSVSDQFQMALWQACVLLLLELFLECLSSSPMF